MQVMGLGQLHLSAPSGMSAGVHFGQYWLPEGVACSQAGDM